MLDSSAGPKLTVDCVVFHDESVVLVRRLYEPYKGYYALPGGFVEIGETVEQAAAREILEETGLAVRDLRLIGVYSDPQRDPWRHTVAVAFLGEADLSTLRAGDDASHVEVVKDWRTQQIAFDHLKIITDAWKLQHNE